jgi:tricorn protease
MRKIFIYLMAFSFSLGMAMAQNQAFFATYPSPSPDGKTVYFSYEGDIWSVALSGGQATRITAMSGKETHPRVSPDGKWLAFSGTQDGNANIYIMPVGGGEIKQITWHDGSDLVSSWSWDSKHLYFNSSRYNSVSAYKIPLEGGTPTRLFHHYFNIPHDMLESINGEEVFFTDSWESNNQASRKRYKGAFNPDIKSYNLKTNEYKALTTWEGKDMWPSMDRSGKLYFISDEANGEYNLYTLENGQKKALTQFATSIGNPKVSADGSVVVFEKDYQLFAYHTGSGETTPIPVQVGLNSVLQITQSFEVATNIEAFDVSPDNKKLAFVSRGMLFVSDIKGKFVAQLPTAANERVTEVRWLKDNKTLVFTQTEKGWKNIFSIAADGSSKAVRRTESPMHDRLLTLSPDREKLVYYSGRDEVRLLNLSNFSSELLAKDELWGFQNGTPHFSPDGKWIAYNATINFEKEVKLVELATKRIINLTHSVVSETDPFWSPDGKYVYFSADRTKPSYPGGGTTPSIYRIALQNEERPFRAAEFDKLFTDTKEEVKKPEVKIDERHIDRRWEQVTSSGNQSRPYVLAKGGKEYLLYLSNQDGAGTTLWKTTMEPFESNKVEKFKNTRGFVGALTEAGGTLYGLMGGDIHIVKFEQGDMEKIAISHTFRKNLRDEFDQMFYETWANIDENFYDETFHGIDWKAMRTQYEAYLPKVQTRDNLRVLINDLLGELNTSHMGFTSPGREEGTFANHSTWTTGIEFQAGAPYKVERIIAFSAADKEHINLQKGDELIAVNGVQVDPKMERYYYFTTAGRMDEMKLKFKRGTQEFDVLLRPQSSGATRNQLYDEWMDANQAYVDEKGNKRIAYIHMKNMGGPELTRFLQEMANEAQYRDGLILDLRNNTGGNVHDAVLQVLAQKSYSNWQYRGGGLATQPNFTPADKPIVLLTNEQSLSDAEMTANGFKALKLGTVVGTETYRWIIFTSGFSLMDGSFHRMPAWGCYDLDGNDLELTGVAPDVFVPESFKDRLEGKQPQLDKAIELILKDLN